MPCAQEQEKGNCLAILVFASMLWATEAVPLFVTAMLVPVLVVMLRVGDASQVWRSALPGSPRSFRWGHNKSAWLLTVAWLRFGCKEKRHIIRLQAEADARFQFLASAWQAQPLHAPQALYPFLIVAHVQGTYCKPERCA